MTPIPVRDKKITSKRKNKNYKHKFKDFNVMHWLAGEFKAWNFLILKTMSSIQADIKRLHSLQINAFVFFVYRDNRKCSDNPLIFSLLLP